MILSSMRERLSSGSANKRTLLGPGGEGSQIQAVFSDMTCH